MLTFLRAKLHCLVKDERGASAIEYAVIAAVIIVVGLVAFLGLGGTIDGKFTDVGTALTGSGS